MSKTPAEFQALHLALMTVSDTRTREQDGSGDYLQQQAQAAGHHIAVRALLPARKHELRAQLLQWIIEPAIQVIIVNGGTGYTEHDIVPEAVPPLLDREWLGFGELFHNLSYGDIGSSALQSRAIGGFANGALLLAIPGSPNACALAWEKLIAPQLDSRTRPCSVVPLLRGSKGFICRS